MKRIAMLNCLKSNNVCTGAACLQALEQRRKAFASYGEEEVRLLAFMRCNGCEKNPEQDLGMQEKLDRLQSIGVEIIHAGACTQKRGGECPTITAILKMCEERGMQVVRGTH